MAIEPITEIPGHQPQITIPQGINVIHPKAQKPLNKILFKMLRPPRKLGKVGKIKHKKIKFY